MKKQKIMIDDVETNSLLEIRPSRTYGDGHVSQPTVIEISEKLSKQSASNEVRLEEERNQLAHFGYLDFLKLLAFCFIFKCNTSRLCGGKDMVLPSLCFLLQVRIY